MNIYGLYVLKRAKNSRENAASGVGKFDTDQIVMLRTNCCQVCQLEGLSFKEESVGYP